jgi:phospholipid transport system substrate-binding protein
MPRSKLCLYLIALALMLISGSPSRADTRQQEAREELARNMALTTLSIIKDQKKRPADRQDLLQRGFENVVDIPWIARFVLGSAWRAASEEQKVRYVKLYRDYLTRVYVENYAESPDKKITDIKVLGVENTEGENFTARTQIALSNAAPIGVDYLVSQREGGFKVIDVVIEGVSLLSSHRSQFREITASGGVDAVIRQLEQL